MVMEEEMRKLLPSCPVGGCGLVDGSSVGVLDSIGGREWRFGVDGRLPCFDLGMQAMDGDE